MNIRYPEYWEVRENENGLQETDILVCITNDYVTDAVVGFEGLLELRAKIDRFLFTELKRTASGSAGSRNESP